MSKDDVQAVTGVQDGDSVVNSIPTDEELSAAFDAAEIELEGGETPTEPVVESTVTVPAEPSIEVPEDDDGEGDDDLDEQRDRSRIGRRMKRMEGTIETLLQKLEAQEQKSQMREYLLMQQIAQARGEQPGQDVPNTDEPNYVSTDKDVERVLDERERRKAEAAERYQNTFVATLNGLSGANPKMHKVIVQELIQNFNRKVTGNPEIDARLNYAEAKSAVMAKVAAQRTVEKPKPNVAGNTQPAATGVSASSTAQKGRTSDIWSKLDKEAAEYARAVGMKEEDIEAALAGETPINLRPNKRIG